MCAISPPTSGCVSGSDVACLRSLQVASDQPQNNVIIGVLRLTRLETVIQIRAQGRTRCQSDSSSLRSASKQSELSASAPHLYNFMTWKKQIISSTSHSPTPLTFNGIPFLKKLQILWSAFGYSIYFVWPLMNTFDASIWTGAHSRATMSTSS